MYTSGCVYLSYYHENKKEYDYAKQLLEVVNERDYEGLYFKKGHLSSNSDLIKLQVESKIIQSEAIIIVIGKDTHTYKYIDYELYFAASYKKKIIGIYLKDEEKSELPNAFTALKKVKYKKLGLLKWNKRHIVEAFNGKYRWIE